ncbi:MAG: hypothetical protein WBL28_08065 [Methylotenera sp.]
MNKSVILFLLASGLLGCASAPKPAECKGEFKPVNAIEKKGAALNKTSAVVRCNKGELHGNEG